MEKFTVVITKDQDGEYRVPGPDATEMQAYYTDDKEDAIGTAKHVFKDLGEKLQIRIRSVVEHPNS